MPPDSRTARLSFWLPATLFLCLIPWFVLEPGKSIHRDLVWMIECAARYLQGHTMTDDFFHQELPLSTIIYIPAYLLSKGISVSRGTAILLTTSAYVMLSCLAVFQLARRLVEKNEAMLLASLAALAFTAAAIDEFGQRDFVLGLSLLPFVLGQIILTRKIECPRALLAAVFAAGAVLVLLKPHHGLIPVLFLAHRAITQKRWSVVFDMDFVALAAATSGYIAFIWFFFPDFVRDILPDALLLYPMTYSNIPLTMAIAAALAVLYGCALLLYRVVQDEDSRRRWLINALLLTAIADLIPYMVQMKDFRYHLTPSLAFFWTGGGYFLYAAARRKMAPVAATCLAVIVVAGAGYVANPPSAYTKHAEMKELALTKLIKSCAPHCGFVVYTVSMAPNHITSYYAGAQVASRFPDMWFLPSLVYTKTMMDRGERTSLTKDKVKALALKYAGLMREDLDKKRPTLVITCQDDFDYLGFVGLAPGFDASWKHYWHDGKIPVDYNAYYPDHSASALGVQSCDVYRRKTGE